MAGIVRAEETPPAVRVQGIAYLWERGWGKAPQSITGENGEGGISVIIRHILEAPRDQRAPLQLDHVKKDDEQ